jgi:hypothetical protein
VIDSTLNDPINAKQMARRGTTVTQRYSTNALAAKLKSVYEEVIEEKRCAT